VPSRDKGRGFSRPQYSRKYSDPKRRI